MRHLQIKSLSLMLSFFGLVVSCSLVQAQSTVDFDFLSFHQVKLEPFGVEAIKLHGTVVNTGTETDKYDVYRTEDLPSEWYSALCIGGLCVRPDVDTLKSRMTLNPDDSDSFSVYIYPIDVEGGGSIILTVRSNNNPTLTRSLKFVGITTGTDVLIVDDDGEQTYEQYYENALGDTRTHGTWIRCCQQVTAVDLGFFDTAIWLTGNAYPSLTPADQAAITGYLAGGGNLFLSGQDIGWSLCDPEGSDYSLAACEFYQNVLRASYGANASGDLTLSGANGDGISHGLAIDLSGGDGADNQTSPSIISPVAPAKTVFTYDGSQAGAVWVATGLSKVVYFAFGFEAINSEAMRQKIMLNILDRFAYDGEKGDVNHDGSVNVLDVLQGANIILAVMTPTPAQEWRADFDNNDTINVLDLMGMVNIILGGGAN